ncbi:MAG: 50S ribosomal protein L24 [Rhodospirillaceae bacterium]|nr:50S ribosomal protein L24 [Rhodospirillaceae bacterium]
MAKLKIKKGDKVVVLTGRDRGKTGEVVKAFPRESKVIVRGVNMIKRHQKPTTTVQGGIIEREAKIHVSNVSHIDPNDSKPTRIGFKMLEDGTKVRVARRSGEVID